MQNDRLQQLLNMQSVDKQDHTLKYMIALEYKNIQDPLCEKYFFELKNDFPDYLATYYLAGEYFYEKEEYETSTSFLQKGLEVAEACGNKKTYEELKNLLFNVEMES